MQRFCDKHYRPLDPSNVPERFHALIPLAEKWGINYVEELDDYEIHHVLFSEATLEEIQEFVRESGPYIGDLYDWLGGEAATKPPFSKEYLAFTFLGMAHTFGAHILRGVLPKPPPFDDLNDFIDSL